MEFKLAFFIFGLMHFKRCVASDNDCLDMMKQYPEQAKGFAEINATQKRSGMGNRLHYNKCESDKGCHKVSADLLL